MGLFDLFGKKNKGEMAIPLPPIPVQTAEPVELPQDFSAGMPEVKGRTIAPMPEEISSMPDFRDSSSSDFGANAQSYDTNPSFSHEDSQFSAAKTAASPKQIFVSVEDYKVMVEGADIVKQKLAKADEFILRMAELKKHCDKEIQLWKSDVESVEKKLAFVEEVIAQGV